MAEAQVRREAAAAQVAVGPVAPEVKRSRSRHPVPAPASARGAAATISRHHRSDQRLESRSLISELDGRTAERLADTMFALTTPRGPRMLAAGVLRADGPATPPGEQVPT